MEQENKTRCSFLLQFAEDGAMITKSDGKRRLILSDEYEHHFGKLIQQMIAPTQNTDVKVEITVWNNYKDKE